MEKGKVTTIDIELALMRFFDLRKNLIVPNVFWGMGLNHEADIICLRPSGYAIEIEIKISKQNLKADFKKKHNHDSVLLKELYYAVPEKLVEAALELIPETAGLISVTKNSYDHLQVRKIRDAIKRKDAVKWDDKMRYQLARLGSLRIQTLKSKIKRLYNQIDQYKWMLKKQ
jgi:hypothetical protein